MKKLSAIAFILATISGFANAENEGATIALALNSNTQINEQNTVAADTDALLSKMTTDAIHHAMENISLQLAKQVEDKLAKDVSHAM